MQLVITELFSGNDVSVTQGSDGAPAVNAPACALEVWQAVPAVSSPVKSVDSRFLPAKPVVPAGKIFAIEKDSGPRRRMS